MKKQLQIFLLLWSCTFFAQDIKIKKQQVLLNNIPVAVIKNPYRDHYEYSTLSGEKIFQADLKGILQSTSPEVLYYIIIQSADGSKKAEIPYEVLVTSLNSERIITHNLAVKYNVFTSKGIDINALEKIYEKGVGEFSTIAAEAKSDAGEISQKISGIEANFKPKVTNSDEIISSSFGSAAKIIGRIKMIPCSAFDSKNCVSIYDLDGTLVATVKESKDGHRKYEVNTYDGKKFFYNSKEIYTPSNKFFATELVTRVMAEGYMLGHQAKSENQKIRDARIDDAKQRSVNLYGIPGFVIEKNGTKTEGNVTIYFQKLDINNTGEVLPTEMADKFGQAVIVKYINDKNQPRSKTINASTGAQFCVKNGLDETCYYGLEVKGEAMKKLQNLNSLSFNNSYYYELLFKGRGVYVFQDPVEKEKLVIKTDKEQKGLMLDRGSADKDGARLAEYLQDCKSVVADIKSNSFNIREIDDLIQIAKEYGECRK